MRSLRNLKLSHVNMGVFMYLILSICITGLLIIGDSPFSEEYIATSSNLEPLKESRINYASYVTHGRIEITGNDDFNTTALAEGWSGNGTQGNPYIIENYLIDLAGAHYNCIYLLDVSSHFIIRNCYLTGAYIYPYEGISLFNVSNGLVTDNICTGNSNGISVLGNPPRVSYNNTISNNNCSYNTRIGIYVTYSHDNVVANNTCSNNPDYGIMVCDDGSNTVRNNTCNYSLRGIYVLNCNNNILQNNTCNFNDQGIYVYNGDQTTIVDNKLCYNTARGIFLEASQSHRIAGNLCVNNTRHIDMTFYGGYPIANNTCINGSFGISLRAFSTTTLVVNNTCINNDHSGIYLYQASYHLIINNTLDGNGRGIYIRASRYEDIINNTIISNINGTYFDNGDLCFVNENDFQNNMNGAVLYSNSNSNNLANNTFSGTIDSCMRIESSVGNTITNNTLYGSNYGISIDNLSYSNSIIWNAFIDLITNAQDNGTPNNFDYNYWFDYSGADVNNDGIGDILYYITGLGQTNDTHPLILPPGSAPMWFEIPSDILWGPSGVFNYDLNATASPPGIDTWWLNNTSFSIDAIGIITNVTGLSDGYYPLRVWVNDSLGEEISSVFTIIVDTLPPYWIQLPSEQYSEFGSLFRYDLNATDITEIDSWWLNDTLNFYITPEGLVQNGTQLEVDNYGVQVWVNDTAARVLTGIFTVTVEDRTAPSWVDQPSNQVTEISGSFIYPLSATDLSGVVLWSINDTTYFSIDENGIVSNAIVLPVSIYWLEVRAYDPFGNNCTGVFRVVCLDTSLPSWATQPTNQIVEYGDQLTFYLDAVDFSGIQFYRLNDTEHFFVDSEGLVTNATPLSIGIYWIRVVAFDPSLNNCTATILITVSDTTAPMWVGEPSNQIVEYGVEFYYDLNATDLSEPLDWQVDDTLRFTVDWQGRVRSIAQLTPGSYGLRVYVRDLYRNLLISFLTVTVQDTTPPSWFVIPTTQVIISGQEFDYQLEAMDISDIDQWMLNDTVHFNIDTNGRITSYGILDIGAYGINVTVIDSVGNARSTTFSVIVQEFTPTTSTTTTSMTTTPTGTGTTTTSTTTVTTTTQPTTSPTSLPTGLVELDRTFVIMMLAGLGGAIVLNVILLVLYRRAIGPGKERS